ncbi:hypothetical protein OU994_30500 [Pseudoduganella sp. SL102]|uniref:hypothetical protein n=1 Tax=Pseudoduganella sp. SL102 TaxID=2995154 RepID=UPI00248B4758|nr:hypothetical protein [Pseudoduganella sp. SL102]WBS02522.1 hypothetical protein OU994_30500 [Pseudoduganella sp. SL102]
MKRSLIAALAALLAACSREEAPAAAAQAAAKPATTTPAAPTARPSGKAGLHAQLMHAVFGDAYRPGRGDALADLPDEQSAGAVFAAVQTAADSLRLPSGDTVLVVAGEQADDNGEPASSHAASGHLSFYLLRPDNGGWKVLRRQENVAQLGSHGSVGMLSWVTLPDGRPLLAAQHGGTWQGYSITTLSLFDPAAEKIADLAGIALHSDSEGGCNPEGGHCWNVEAEWHFEPAPAGGKYPDLVLDFKGYDMPEREGAQESAEEVQASGDGQHEAGEETHEAARERRAIAGSARYRFEHDKYQLKEGANLVPSV